MTRKKYLWQHQSGRWYVRKSGRYYPITATEGTSEFDAQYWQILNGRAAQARRSWSPLIAELKRTEKWAGFSPRYRKDLEPILLYLEDKIGSKDVSLLRPKHVYEAMDANTHRVRFANYIPVAVTLLARLARRKGWRADNPAENIERLAVPKHRQKPHYTWPDDAVQKMRDEGAELPRLIFEIGIGSVQRPGGWVGFTWGDYDGKRLSLVQNKTGLPLKLPCTEELRKALNRAKKKLATPVSPERPILARKDGSAMSYFTIARIMREERAKLGLSKYDLHALRYRGVKELAYAGCSDEEIGSFSGHISKSMIRKYAGEARQEMQAQKAHAKRERFRVKS
ncbi:tyrosine-type recombinase/integrase [Rhodovulum sulfidophilum]|uniref:tyrosine-type recombinase/integrase n=1 Tax=Rhodovulum sulfidophilum TaxID=35806 RepID=UPI001F395556|nr:tyrosine-type recombinase/integrase [Rhodovulum sulfidophilum]MCE8431770.1 tyrosine-type recombinase/integrase [Rhodovulum sulfidophilum]MCF4115290.1 tyrosine-type recombinase/integrase [Rhodovulum sulfidophilum]